MEGSLVLCLSQTEIVSLDIAGPQVGYPTGVTQSLCGLDAQLEVGVGV